MFFFETFFRTVHFSIYRPCHAQYSSMCPIIVREHLKFFHALWNAPCTQVNNHQCCWVGVWHSVRHASKVCQDRCSIVTSFYPVASTLHVPIKAFYNISPHNCFDTLLITVFASVQNPSSSVKNQCVFVKRATPTESVAYYLLTILPITGCL